MKTTTLQVFQPLLESVADAIVVVNEVGEIVLINSATENLFGYSREDLLGYSIERLLPGHFQERHLEYRKAYFGDSGVRPVGAGLELRTRSKDGREFQVEISLSLLETDDGTYAAAAIHDISEVLREEKQYRLLFDANPRAHVGR